MGVIGKILGQGGAMAVGRAVQGVAEVFTPNATRAQELSADAQMAALQEMAAEFAHGGGTWFDSLINGLNRLPRPFLALGTVGLFVFAMVDPPAFAARMAGLNAVPEPLWWLLGAIVAFYFGARETHYFRANRPVAAMAAPIAQAATAAGDSGPQNSDNPALDAWRRGK